MSPLEVNGSKLLFLESLLLCLSFVASFTRFYQTTEVFLVVKMVVDDNLRIIKQLPTKNFIAQLSKPTKCESSM